MTPTVASIGHVWGSTPREREQSFPCDRHVRDATDALFRAVDVDAPPAVVFRWLCQLKVAPYSYDWIDNAGRRSPRTLTPGLEVLAVGQRVMGVFELVELERDRHLTMMVASPAWQAILGAFACSYVVVPRGPGRSRLIVKFVARYPRGPVGTIVRWLTPWADLVMMRKQLLTLKGLAETCSPSSS
jgi:hypothetical protein